MNKIAKRNFFYTFAGENKNRAQIHVRFAFQNKQQTPLLLTLSKNHNDIYTKNERIRNSRTPQAAFSQRT